MVADRGDPPADAGEVGQANLHIAVLAAATMGVSFAIQVWVITTLGPGSDSDAYFGVAGIPALLLALLADSLALVLVPSLATLSPRDQVEEVGNILYAGAAILAVPAGVLWATAELWTRAIFPGFDGDGLANATMLARIELPAVVLYGLAEVFRAFRFARSSFVFPAASSLIATASALGVMIFAYPRFGLVALGWAFVVRGAVDLLLLGAGVFEMPMLRPRRSGRFRDILKRTGPILAVTGYARIDGLVDRSLASLAPSGSLSLLVFGQQVLAAVGQILNRSLVVPSVPKLTGHHASGAPVGFLRLYRRRRRLLLAIGATALVGLFTVGQKGLGLLTISGAVSNADTTVLWGLMLALGGLLIGDAAGNLSANGFYARLDTVTPSRISAILFTASLGIKVLSFLLLGVVGLALTTSAYYLARFAWLDRRLVMTVKSEAS